MTTLDEVAAALQSEGAMREALREIASGLLERVPANEECTEFQMICILCGSDPCDSDCARGKALALSAPGPGAPSPSEDREP